MAVLLLGTQEAQADTLFQVIRHAFCSRIANSEAAGVYGDPAVVKSTEQIAFWFEVKVSAAGYKYLRQFGHLPIRVAWGYNGFLTGQPVDVGITEAQWQQKRDAIAWAAKSSDDGSFTWRTNAVRPQPIPKGKYYVAVSDPNRLLVAIKDLDSPRPEINVVLR